MQEEHRSDYEHALQVCLDRNAHLAQFMANFAHVVRIPAPVKRPCNLHELLYSIHHLMKFACEKQEISWCWALAPGSLPVEVDMEQFEQVLINITKNAIEAVEADGFIRVRTQQHPPTLVIEDNGKGISEEVRERLFTHFLSTKRDGQGIGLTLIREILMNHRFLLIEIEGLTGTAFGNLSYKFDKNWRLSSNFSYTSPRMLIQGKSAGYINNIISLAKQFLRDNKASINIAVSNPFQRERLIFTELNDPAFFQRQKSFSIIRRYNVSLNYRFGKLKEDITREKRGTAGKTWYRK